MDPSVDVRARTSFSQDVLTLDYGWRAQAGDVYHAFRCFSLANGSLHELSLLRDVLTANPYKFNARRCSLNVIVEPRNRIEKVPENQLLHDQLMTFGMGVWPVDQLEEKLPHILGPASH